MRSFFSRMNSTLRGFLIIIAIVFQTQNEVLTFAASGSGGMESAVANLVKPGTKVPARMVSPTGSAAYVGSAAPRWVPSLLAVLLCGLGIAWLTGGYRLPGRRRKLFVFGLSLAGPLLIVAGMLAVTW